MKTIEKHNETKRRKNRMEAFKTGLNRSLDPSQNRQPIYRAPEARPGYIPQ